VRQESTSNIKNAKMLHSNRVMFDATGSLLLSENASQPHQQAAWEN